MDFKREFCILRTGGNTQPSAALISKLHSCSVHSIRYADCCTGKPAASGNKFAAGRRHIALDLFVFLCSKIEFSPDSLACLQGNLQPFLRKRRGGCPYLNFPLSNCSIFLFNMVHLFFLLSVMRFYISRKMNTRFTFSTRFLLYTTMGTGARKYQTLCACHFLHCCCSMDKVRYASRSASAFRRQFSFNPSECTSVNTKKLKCITKHSHIVFCDTDIDRIYIPLSEP